MYIPVTTQYSSKRNWAFLLALLPAILWGQSADKNLQKYDPWIQLPDNEAIAYSDLDPSVYDADITASGNIWLALSHSWNNEGGWAGGLWILSNETWQFQPEGLWQVDGENTSLGLIQGVSPSPSGKIYVYGQFNRVYDQSCSGLALWNGQSWEVVDGGLSALFYDSATNQTATITDLQVDAAGKLYAFGQLRINTFEKRLLAAVYNGQQWQLLAQLNGGFQPFSFSVDASGTLYCMGIFPNASGGEAQVAVWQGSQWYFYPNLVDSGLLTGNETGVLGLRPQGVAPDGTAYLRVTMAGSNNSEFYGKNLWICDGQTWTRGDSLGFEYFENLHVDAAGTVFITGSMDSNRESRVYRKLAGESEFLALPIINGLGENVFFDSEGNLYDVYPGGGRMLSADFVRQTLSPVAIDYSEGEPDLFIEVNDFFDPVDVQNLTFGITNSGDETVTVSGIDYPSGFSGDWGGGPLTPGQTREVTLSFSPTEGWTYNYYDWIVVLVDGRPVDYVTVEVYPSRKAYIPNALRASHTVNYDLFYSDWYGLFLCNQNFDGEDENAIGYLYSIDFGWVWMSPAGSSEGVWWWSFGMGSWLWGSEDTGRFFYRDSDQAWLYVVSFPDGGCFLYNTATQAWSYHAL